MRGFGVMFTIKEAFFAFRQGGNLERGGVSLKKVPVACP